VANEIETLHVMIGVLEITIVEIEIVTTMIVVETVTTMIIVETAIMMGGEIAENEFVTVTILSEMTENLVIEKMVRQLGRVWLIFSKSFHRRLLRHRRIR
jgi:hypothetical protein